MIMKKRIQIFVLVALLLLISLPVISNAHPGRTDSKGGHTDHSTGEYHYHHGYSEHDHTDTNGDGILECPYDNKDKTSTNSSNNSSNNSYNKNSGNYSSNNNNSNKNNTYTTKPPTGSTTKDTNNKKEETKKDSSDILGCLVIASIGSFIITIILGRIISELVSEKSGCFVVITIFVVVFILIYIWASSNLF